MGVGVRSAPIVRVPVSVYAFFFSLNFAEFVERGTGSFFGVGLDVHMSALSSHSTHVLRSLAEPFAGTVSVFAPCCAVLAMVWFTAFFFPPFF